MKIKKVWAIIAFLCILAGSFCLGIGLAFRGTLHDGLGVNFGKNVFGIGVIDNKTDNDVSPTTVSLHQIESIKMEIDRGDVEIKQGDTFALTVEHLSEDNYVVSTDDGILHVRYDADTNFSLFHFSFGEEEPVFTLTIPQGHTLDDITIESKLGDVTVENVSTNNMDITQHMGDIDCIQVSCSGKIDLDEKMGDVTYKGKKSSNLSIDNKMGEIDIEIYDTQADYHYDLETSMGDIEINDQETGGMNAHESGGDANAKYQITANNSMGDITLEFQ